MTACDPKRTVTEVSMSSRMTTSTDKEMIENRSRSQNLIVAMVAAVLSSSFLVLTGHLFGNWGFLRTWL